MRARQALGSGSRHAADSGPAPVRKRLRVAGTPLEFTIFLEPPGEGHDPVSAHLAPQDELTLPNALLMLQFLRPRQFVLDLGAHLGSLALVAAAAGCHVAAVDASPRNVALLARGKEANDQNRPRIKKINEMISKLDKQKNVRYLDIGDKFLEKDGSLSKDIMPDYLHLSAKGYKIWADAV